MRPCSLGFFPANAFFAFGTLQSSQCALGGCALEKRLPRLLGTRLQGKTTLVKVRVAFWLGLCHRYESRITEEIPARLITLTWQ
jgi:hypothetical protein